MRATGPVRYLNVPYKDRDEARSCGCRWDAQTRHWYAPMHVPLQYVERWLIKE